jgi:hypothetical protein
MRGIFLGVGFLAIHMAPAAADAQAAPALPDFRRPAWTAAEPFTATASVRELRSGQLLVTDLREPSLRLMDARGRTLRIIGRAGSGPGEYREPTMLIPLPADSTILIDRNQRRYVLFAPDGTALQTQGFPPELGEGAMLFRGLMPDGRLVFQTSWLARDPQTDSPVFIAAWRRATTQVDTMAALRPPRAKVRVNQERKSVNMMVMPYEPQDDWAVGPAGQIAIVRADPYQVEWLVAGSKVTGPVIPFERVAVIASERGGTPSFEYPDFKPPFVPGTPRVDYQGHLWVRRYAPSGAATLPWDVFDRLGQRIATIQLPKDRELLGFGPGHAFVIRTDGDGVEWLEAY